MKYIKQCSKQWSALHCKTLHMLKRAINERNKLKWPGYVVRDEAERLQTVELLPLWQLYSCIVLLWNFFSGLFSFVRFTLIGVQINAEWVSMTWQVHKFHLNAACLQDNRFVLARQCQSLTLSSSCAPVGLVSLQPAWVSRFRVKNTHFNYRLYILNTEVSHIVH